MPGQAGPGAERRHPGLAHRRVQRMTRLVGFLLLCLVVLAGCSDKTDTQRWSSMRWDDSPLGNDVEARVYVAPDGATGVDPSLSNPFAGWSDGAQGALVNAI